MTEQQGSLHIVTLLFEIIAISHLNHTLFIIIILAYTCSYSHKPEGICWGRFSIANIFPRLDKFSQRMRNKDGFTCITLTLVTTI